MSLDLDGVNEAMEINGQQPLFLGASTVASGTPGVVTPQPTSPMVQVQVQVQGAGGTTAVGIPPEHYGGPLGLAACISDSGHEILRPKPRRYVNVTTLCSALYTIHSTFFSFSFSFLFSFILFYFLSYTRHNRSWTYFIRPCITTSRYIFTFRITLSHPRLTRREQPTWHCSQGLIR